MHYELDVYVYENDILPVVLIGALVTLPQSFALYNLITLVLFGIHPVKIGLPEA